MLSIGMGLALDRYGWMMSTVPALNHTLLHAQTVVLEHITVSILRMLQFTAVQEVRSLHNNRPGA